MQDTWQHLPSHIDPVLISIGSIDIRWYSIMYLVALAVVYVLVRWRLCRGESTLTLSQIQHFLGWAFLGVIIGGRLGYVVFYKPSMIIETPLSIISPVHWHGGFEYTGLQGMSYHGGAIGVVIVSVLFCRRHGIGFRQLADLIIPAIPLGYTFGRIGNFINGELYGRTTDVAWGMIFPADPTRSLRHPSQLYEALGEGVLLFVILWSLRNHHHVRGRLLPLYLIGYGGIRFFIEFVRLPDAHLGFVLGPFTMGQILCLAMIAIGAILWWVYPPSSTTAPENNTKP